MRVKEVYDGLIEQWGKQCDDEAWISSIKKDYQLSDKDWNPDCFFLITNSWGPWREDRQKRVFNIVREQFSELLNDISKVSNDFGGYPLSWQNKRLITLGKSLRAKTKLFKDLVADLQAMDALGARDYLAEICGARDKKKTLSCFIRDWLRKDTFPIDRRVDEMLSCLGLPNNEDQVVRLCAKDKVSSRVLNRMLYSHWEHCPSSPNNRCDKCGVKGYCWEYILR